MVIGTPEEGEQPALIFYVYIEGKQRGDEIEGRFTDDVFLDDGTTQIGSGEGVWSATRLTA